MNESTSRERSSAAQRVSLLLQHFDQAAVNGARTPVASSLYCIGDGSSAPVLMLGDGSPFCSVCFGNEGGLGKAVFPVLRSHLNGCKRDAVG